MAPGSSAHSSATCVAGANRGSREAGRLIEADERPDGAPAALERKGERRGADAPAQTGDRRATSAAAQTTPCFEHPLPHRDRRGLERGGQAVRASVRTPALSTA